MAVHPVPGTLHVAPTNATTGGTLLVGVADDRMEFDDGDTLRAFGSGLEADAWSVIRAKPERPAALYIPVRDVSTTTMQLLFSLLSTGSNIASHGGGSTAPFAEPPSVSLVIRPKDTTQNYLYGPVWVLHPLSERRIVWHRNVARFDGATLVLAPQRSANGALRAFMEDTPANINSYYGL